jgi:hypothetical protein
MGFLRSATDLTSRLTSLLKNSYTFHWHSPSKAMSDPHTALYFDEINLCQKRFGLRERDPNQY